MLKIVFNKTCWVTKVTNEIKRLLIRHVAVIFLRWPHHVASDRTCLRPFIFFMRTTASQHKVRKYSAVISRSYIMSIMSPSLKCVIYAVTFVNIYINEWMNDWRGFLNGVIVSLLCGIIVYIADSVMGLFKHTDEVKHGGQCVKGKN